jgi:hypothetical protein
MARLGAQHSTRQEAEELRAKLAAEDPSASFFVFPRDGAWVVAKANVAPRAPDAGTATAARPRPSNADDPRDTATRNIPPFGPALS